MVDYKLLGFESFEEYKAYFYESLMLTNKTYEYYVNWKGSNHTLDDYEKEIEILNSLSTLKENIDQRLEELIYEYPRIIEIIPCLVSEKIRRHPYYVFDAINEDFKEINFRSNATSENNINNIITFAIETGVIELLSQDIDLRSFMLGVYVGNETNARKNRSGKIFEKIVERKLNNLFNQKYDIIREDSNFSLTKSANKRRMNRHDFVIYENNKPIMVLECNFYNDSGSKPNTISREYELHNNSAEEQGIKFVWITDGQGWKKMSKTLEFAMERIDFILNFNMIERISLVFS